LFRSESFHDEGDRKINTMTTESQNFDQGVRKILTVSREELRRREELWKQERKEAKEKRANTSPASRASTDKD
jgi:IS4 transposase